MNPWIFNIGYGIEVKSKHCRRCGFNVTPKDRLNKALKLLRHNMKKEVKIIKIGTGLGLRFPNEIVKSYKLKKGEDILLKPDGDGLRLVTT